MRKVIEAKGVTVSYRHYESATRSIKLNLLMNHKSQKQERFALRDFSIEISSGEIIGVIGNNGAGKSTLAKLIVGSVKPLTGWIRTEGVVTAMIELGAGINMDMTPRENVKLHSAIYGSPLSQSDDRALRICEWAGLLDYIDEPIRTFSSGMTARFAFSLNTDLNPDILILDEVLSVGDREFQEKSLERTKSLMQGGTSVLFVSHDMNSVRNFCSKVVWIDAGKIKMIGTPDEVVKSYESS